MEPGSLGSARSWFLRRDSSGVWAAQAAQQREQQLQRMQRELAEVQLARLADQLQPHFLFNTLNLIASVMHEDVDRADRLLCQLSDLLQIDSVANTLNAQNLGNNPVSVPMYMFHGQADEFIPLAQHVDLKRTYCAKIGRAHV